MSTADPTSRLPRGVQLITYPDSLGGDLATLGWLLDGPLAGWFDAGVHVLPPFPSSGDRGFAPTTYTELDPAFGTWDDLGAVAAHGGLVLDVMINHLSRRSPQFEDFVRHGRRSQWADLFITLDKVWPDGDPPAADVARIFLRKPEHPFSDITIAAGGQIERVWTSFGPRVDWSEQIDLDVWSPLTRSLVEEWFAHLAAKGTTMVRLDAVGYVVKKAGTSCFMVEPEIWEVLAWLRDAATARGMQVLPEVHAPRSTQAELAARGYPVYDFVLPGLVLHTLVSGSTVALRRHLATSPPNQVTMLDCHDGIPVQPDLDEVLTVDEARALVAHCEARGANINRILGAEVAGLAFDAHQINITYPAAAGADDAYLVARAIQLFAPGMPQVYYVGVLAGANDQEAVERTGEGRAVNRHDYTLDEITAALEQPVVQRQAELFRLRNVHPAFDGSPTIEPTPDDALAVTWRSADHWCRLDVSVGPGGPTGAVTGSDLGRIDLTT